METQQSQNERESLQRLGVPGRGTRILASLSLILAGLGTLWSVGWIVVGWEVTKDKTGYDSWDMLGYIGLSTLGLGFFAIGALMAAWLLIYNRFSQKTMSHAPLWIGLVLNVSLAVAFIMWLRRA